MFAIAGSGRIPRVPKPNARHRSGTRVGSIVSGITGLLATALLTAPMSAADITNGPVAISGDTHSVGSTYTVTAVAMLPGTSVYFIDRITGTNTMTPIGTAPSTGTNRPTASIQWAPTTSGAHTLIAEQLGFNGQVYETIGWVDVRVN